MKKIILSISLLIVSFSILSQQCFITSSASKTNSICGDCLEITATGTALGSVTFSENFDNGSPTGWAFTQSADFTNPCSPGNGSAHLWMGDASGNPRDMETVDFDLSVGGMICFDMLYAVQGNASPCEGPDLSDEGVYVQYSTDGGTTWITIDYWDPNGGNDPQLTTWNTYCVQLPAGAQTSSTRIRWHQDDVSGNDFDHWGIDDVTIALTDSTSEITWLHDGYSYGVGNSGGVNPTPVCPRNDTSFIVQITSDTNVCYDTLEITVNDPTLEIIMPTDSLVCPGTCVQIESQAKVIVSAGGIKTFADGQFQTIAGGMGSTSSLDINITDLNMDTVIPGSIQQVCIDGLSYSGFPSGDIGSLDIRLICPGGSEIILVPQGTTSGSTYTNTCFVPVGGSNISSGSNPYSGNWNPNEPFSDLDGCTSNGTWTIEITNNSTFGAGTFNGWNITFDDIEISYPADYTWSPTTAMTNSDSLNPIVCPTNQTTYTLTATDSNNCTSIMDSITILMDTCCLYTVSVDKEDAVCKDTSGMITLIPSGSIDFTYQWDANAGNSTDSIVTGLTSGAYNVSVSDSSGCITPLTIFVNDSMTFSIDTTSHSILGAGCTVNGSISGITMSGGVSPISITWTNSSNSAVGNALDLTNMVADSYKLVISDSLGCIDSTGLYIINQASNPIIDESNVVVSNIGCISTVGSISGVTVNSGTPGYTYEWYDITSNFFIGTNIDFTNIPVGTYYMIVTDTLGCRDTSINFTIINNPLPVLDESNVSITDIDCQNQAGAIQNITTSNGTSPYSYSWVNNNGNQIGTSTNLTNVFNGQYTLIITDANGCKDTSTVYTVSDNTNILADFDLSSTTVYSTNTAISISDQSVNANGYTWLIYDGNGNLINTINNNANPSILLPEDEDCYDIVLAVNNGFCNDTTQDQVCVLGLVPITVPNVFSPNGDGKNDDFIIANLDYYPNTRLEIINRWGQTVYENDNYQNDWKGLTNNGKELTEGTYYYELSNSNWGERVVGHLTLVRK